VPPDINLRGLNGAPSALTNVLKHYDIKICLFDKLNTDYDGAEIYVFISAQGKRN